MSLYVKYLVCYDISNTRTRSKFFDFLKDLGPQYRTFDVPKH